MSAALTLPYVWATACKTAVPQPKKEDAPKGEIAFYRKRAERVLRRYLRASLAVGRVPSVAGDLNLRGRATSYQLKNFEDVVIFAIDVEKCLLTLDPEALHLVVKIAIQEYLLMEVAQKLGQDARTVMRKYGEALDQLSVQFLHKNLLSRD